MTGVPPELRTAVMAASNPWVVLRNWVAQTAIRAAELGHYSTVNSILQLLREPYKTGADAAALEVSPAVAAAAGGGRGGGGVSSKQQQQQAGEGDDGAAGAAAAGVCPTSVKLQFDGKPPAWAAHLCVTCSS